MTCTRKRDSFVAQMATIRKRRSIRSNNNFLLGSLLMIVMVLVIVVLFLYLSFTL